VSAGWVAAGTIEQLASQSRLEAEVDGEFVAVARLDGQLHAFEDRCTHDGEPLAGAELEGDSATPCGVVICPRHGARFCLKTGAALTPPAYEPIRIFEVREIEGRIEVRRS
jgi:3-phenylpropionate/trans-cinnamate dioxygenase ferredoxin subunit